MYDRLFIIFMIGNILGVLLEGTFCFITKGHWESHVVTYWMKSRFIEWEFLDDKFGN